MEPKNVTRTWRDRLRPAIFAVLTAVSIMGASGARALDVFEVRGVETDVTAENANEARTQALATAERKAFELMLKRLTLRSDWPRLPKAGEQGAAMFIRDFSVIREKASSVRYIASLAYRFKPDEIRALLRNYSIPFSETVSKPVLVLPIYREGGAFMLWDDPNPWREAWENRPAVIGLVPTAMPLGDLADIAAISVDQALAGNAERLQAIADRYGAGDVLVVLCTYQAPSGSTPAELQVTVSRFGRTAIYPTNVSSIPAEADETLDSLLSRAALELTYRLEDEWKSENLIQLGDRQSLPAVIAISGLPDWLEVRRRLASVAIVEKVELLLLSRDEARVNLVYSGTPEQLSVALDQVDLGLLPTDTGWAITSSQRGGTAR